MTATENITSMKLKIRIGSKQIVANPVTKQFELSQGHVSGNKTCHTISMSICNKSEVVSSQNIVIPPIDTLRVKFSSLGSNNKRNLSVVGDCQKEKRRKMDRTVTQQCAFILKQLKNHPAGWVFNQPVDPVKLQIPDYHDVISHPMDLGTVKKKLDKNEYSSVDEFVAHVRLTFSNAMTYNPPANSVHVMAKDLNNFFNSEWSALEAKWSGERKNVHQKQIISRIVKSTNISGKNGTKKPPPYAMLEPKSLISASEKQKLREQLLELIRGKVPSHLEGFLRKIGFDLQKVEKIEEIVDALGEEDLWELQKITSSSWVVQAAKVSPAKEPEHVGQQSRLITPKGPDSGIGNASASVNFIEPPKSVTSRCGVCHSVRCVCNKQSNKAYAASDILSEGSQDDLDVHTRDCGTKLHSDLQLRKSEPGSQTLNEDRISSCPPVSTTVTTATSAEVVDIPLSPQKALRAALLKSRFADTIFKAKQKALLDLGDKADPVKLQQEKERLEREQQEERARIEAQIKTAEEAARIRAEAERKLQREREREAARLALQQMVKTVEIDNDHKILIDLELLSGCSLSVQLSCGSCESSPKTLEQLGLFMKDDHMEDEDEDTTIISSRQGDDGEEGEIIS